MSKRVWVITIAVFSFICFGAFAFLLFVFSLLRPDFSDPNGDIAIVEVKGPIFDSEAINEKLEKFRKAPSVKAVVLRVDSPGGAVGPSQEIYSEVKRLAAEKKVVVSMGAVAASGGYYLSIPATKILANPGTLTGSIGVLIEHIEVDELLKWAKISAETITAGEMKDAGSLFRKMKPEERAYFDEILKNMHQQFRLALSEGRKIPMDEVEKIADGRVYTGEQALALKLVDQLGDLQDAILVAKDLAGIVGEPKLIKPEKPHHWFDLLGGDLSEEKFRGVFSSLGGYRALYWMSL